MFIFDVDFLKKKIFGAYPPDPHGQGYGAVPRPYPHRRFARSGHR